MPAETVDKREVLNNIRLRDYDRLVRAQGIIRDAYYKAHPRTNRPMGPLSRGKDGKPLYNGAGPRDGILACGSPITHDEVKLKIDVDGRVYSDHKSCDSWACPICARKMANKRADEIRQALVGANENGYKCLFLTFTVPHRKSHTSAYVLKMLDTCYNKMLQARAIRDMKDDYKFVGQIKCKDYTVGDNGLHAHLHCIWIFDVDRDKNGKPIKGEISPDGVVSLYDGFDLAKSINAITLDKWDTAVYNETGKHINRKHGFDLELVELGDPNRVDADKVAHYAAKSISVYMSDNDKEKGSKTPFDFLDSTATDEERAMYLDFYKGQKGKRHIVFSRGLKEHLGVSEPEYDPKPSAVVAWIGYENAYLLKDEARRQEFEAIAADSVSDALKWLDDETQKQQAELRRRYFGSPKSKSYRDNELIKGDYVLPHMPALDAMDAPGRDLEEVVSRFQNIQEVVFPHQIEEWSLYQWYDRKGFFGSLDDQMAYIQDMNVSEWSRENGIVRYC